MYVCMYVCMYVYIYIYMYSICKIKYSIYNIQFTRICNLQYTIYKIQCTMYKIEGTTTVHVTDVYIYIHTSYSSCSYRVYTYSKVFFWTWLRLRLRCSQNVTLRRGDEVPGRRSQCSAGNSRAHGGEEKRRIFGASHSHGPQNGLVSKGNSYSNG